MFVCHIEGLSEFNLPSPIGDTRPMENGLGQYGAADVINSQLVVSV